MLGDSVDNTSDNDVGGCYSMSVELGVRFSAKLIFHYWSCDIEISPFGRTGLRAICRSRFRQHSHRKHIPPQ